MSRSSSTDSLSFRIGEVSTVMHVRARKPVKFDIRVASPYMVWLKHTKEYEPQPRHAFFKTIGRAPVDRPVRPARLTPVRGLSTPQPDEKLSCDPSDSEDIRGALPRTMSQSCCEVINDQDEIRVIDALGAYKSCSFFEACSQGFIHDLAWAGGASAWQGIIVPSGDYVYRCNDLGQSLFIIARGIAEIIISDWETEEIGLYGYLGEMQVLGVLSRRHETIRAKSSLHLLEVKASVLTMLLKRTRKGEMLSCGYSVNESDAQLNLLEKSTTHKIGQAFYPEERRHFESEAVRMHKEMFGGGQSRASVVSSTHRSSKEGTTPVSRPSISHAFSRCSITRSSEFQTPVHEISESDRMQSQLNDLLHSAEMSRTQEHDHLMSRIAGSLRTDVKHGFMMPANSELVPNWERPIGGTSAMTSRSSRVSPVREMQSQASSLRGVSRQSHVSGRVVMPQNQAVQSLASHSTRADVDEEDYPSECSDPLDLELLPPVSVLGTVQKHGLYRQLKAQLMKIKKATRSGATSHIGSRLGSRMGSRMGSRVGSRMGSRMGSILSLFHQDFQTFDAVSVVSTPRPGTRAQTPSSTKG